jgi:hypothetical protein
MTLADDPEHARFAELNALAGVLPYHRRDELSALLSDADVATLRHLVESGMGANTLRAIASDLAYLERWALGAGGDRRAVGRGRTQIHRTARAGRDQAEAPMTNGA